MSGFIEADPGAAVIERAAQGDRDAHRLIYELYSRPVYALVLRLVGSRSIAEELHHDVFVEVLRNCGAWRGSGPFGAWLRSIAVRKCLAHLRSPWRRVLAIPLGDEHIAHENDALPASTAHPGVEALDSIELERALARLPPLSRAVVWLHDVEGYTHREIAEALGRTVSFSKSQLARAHLRLRDLLDGSAEENSSCTQASAIF